MTNFQAIDRYLQQSQPRHLDLLKEWLRIPSVSADPRAGGECRKSAQWVSHSLAAGGFETELIETDGPPLVLAQSPPVPGKPVALVYGHYDVQPPDPLDKWTTPAFEPTERDGKMFARGATDDKGQALTHVLGAGAWQAAGLELPMQVKFLIEGEEEVGSSQLAKWLPKIKDRLNADVIVISDSSQYGPGQPAITYGLRGIAYYEIRLHGPKHDLHSGSFGGAVRNPCIALAHLISQMIDDEGRIQLPGFYDSVKPIADSERQMWQALAFDDKKFAEQLGLKELAGEQGYSTLERRWARPTFDVNGLMGGYQGEGGKTIIPAWAAAKISFRLVPNQSPEDVTRQLKAFLDTQAPVGVRVELIEMHGGRGVVVDPGSPYMAAAGQAIEDAFGKKPVLIREGGSIPIVAQMVQATGADVLLLGWGQEDDGAHSPNEKFSIDDFYRGIRASAHLWQHLSAVT